MDNPYRSAAPPPTRSDVRCLYCGALHAAGTRSCSCGVWLPAPELHDDGATLGCPRCRQPLEMVRLEDGIEARRCSFCDGMFVSPWAWAELLSRAHASQVARFYGEELRQPLPSAKLFEIVYCPRCRTQMDRASFAVHSDVVVDVCVWHGIWFDAGELLRAVGWLEKHPQVRIETSLIYEKLIGMGARLGLLQGRKP